MPASSTRNPAPEPTPDYIDRLIVRWEKAKPARAQFRAQESLLRLVRVAGRLRHEMDSIAEEHGLLTGQAQALATLRWYDPDPATPKDVIAATTLTSGAVTALLDKLEEKKLLARHADPADRRGTWLRLTDRGRSLADAIITTRLTRNERWLAPLTATERTILTALLRKLLEAGETPPVA